MTPHGTLYIVNWHSSLQQVYCVGGGLFASPIPKKITLGGEPGSWISLASPLLSSQTHALPVCLPAWVTPTSTVRMSVPQQNTNIQISTLVTLCESACRCTEPKSKQKYHMKNKLSVQGKYLVCCITVCVTITLMKLDHARPIDAARRQLKHTPCRALSSLSHEILQLCNNTD